MKRIMTPVAEPKWGDEEREDYRLPISQCRSHCSLPRWGQCWSHYHDGKVRCTYLFCGIFFLKDFARECKVICNPKSLAGVYLHEEGVTTGQLEAFSDRAHVILPYHIELTVSKRAQHENSTGTTSSKGQSAGGDARCVWNPTDLWTA